METARFLRAETRLCSVSTFCIRLVSIADICPDLAADICLASAAGIHPLSTAGVSLASMLVQNYAIRRRAHTSSIQVERLQVGGSGYTRGQSYNPEPTQELNDQAEPYNDKRTQEHIRDICQNPEKNRLELHSKTPNK